MFIYISNKFVLGCERPWHSQWLSQGCFMLLIELHLFSATWHYRSCLPERNYQLVYWAHIVKTKLLFSLENFWGMRHYTTIQGRRKITDNMYHLNEVNVKWKHDPFVLLVKRKLVIGIGFMVFCGVQGSKINMCISWRVINCLHWWCGLWNRW